MNTDILTNWINSQKPHLIENGIRIQCNTENVVPIVVPGLSTSSSSSSSTSSSMTSSTVSSERVDRQERRDRKNAETRTLLKRQKSC